MHLYLCVILVAADITQLLLYEPTPKFHT